jgi:hypothetical protein
VPLRDGAIVDLDGDLDLPAIGPPEGPARLAETDENLIRSAKP